MDTRNNNMSDLAGYTASHTGAHLLLPHAVAKAVEAEQAIANDAVSLIIKAEAQSHARISIKSTPTPVSTSGVPNALSIRVGSNHDLANATKLAERILKKVNNHLDPATAAFSKHLFIATAMYVSYAEKTQSLQVMLDFLIDPTWDSELQMLYCLRDAKTSFQQKAANVWFGTFIQSIKPLSAERAARLVKRCHAHWSTAINIRDVKLTPKVNSNSKSKSSRPIQVFMPEAVDKAIESLSNIAEARRGGGDVVLDNARLHDGFRRVPDAKKAFRQLDKTKLQFENLAAPIERLQTDLALASAMNPADFRMTPILLLGDPGIGKTYLAMQLAKALGVNMDKISAGGAQGGFQLTGSHNSWNGARPGALFTLLAEGQFATPVVVIDEVDKIRDSQYPVLPVLLDLFEPQTARCFKDEFFEMQFDASRIIFVLTANSLEGVPAPLLSRLEVFDIARPEAAQRLRIILNEAANLRRKTGMNIRLDKVGSEALADRQDIDLRKTTRLVSEAFARALQAGELVAKLLVPKVEGRFQIGFRG
jgi:ATP-dependent Lon protease